MRKTLIGLTIVLSIGATTMGCSRDSSNTTVDLGSQQATAAASTTAADPKKEASDQAIALATRYYQTVSRLDSDYSVPVNSAAEVMSNPVLDLTKADVTLRRSQGITITGEIRVTQSKVVETQTGGQPARAKVRVCVDTSSLDAKFPNGSSAMAPGRVTSSASTLTMENPKWPDSSGWRVVGDQALQERKQEPCDAPQ